MMPVNKQLCRDAGVKPGDTIEVVMQRDDEQRVVNVPKELKALLRSEKRAKANWEKLSYTHKKEIAKWLADAKRDETRDRRVAKVTDVLKEWSKWDG